MSEVLEFIKIFQSPSNNELFQECACYWFAKILQERFEGSSIVYNPSNIHFATKIKDRIYDISGQVEYSSDYIDWEEYSTYSYDANLIIENCILLKGGEL